tara:strand:- start:2525 stop:2836 length:312 start_codon:yes stop_codon:yes gene_type:complete
MDTYLYFLKIIGLYGLTTTELYLVIFGFFSQSFYFLRWIIQWIKTEIASEVTVPIIFWILSICGALATLTYALMIHSAPFVFGQLIALVIYIRNLIYTLRANQ